MKKIVLFLEILLLFLLIGCGQSSYIYKNGYIVEKVGDLSDITIESIKKSSDIKKGIIVIDGKITARVAKATKLKLQYLNNKSSVINLYLTTEGGWLSDAFKIVDAIKTINTPVNIYVKRYCKSAGVVVLLGATGKRYAYKNSQIILHFNRNYHSLNPQSQAMTRRFEALYRSKTSIPSSWYPLSGNRIIKLTPQEALKYGIIDEIIE